MDRFMFKSAAAAALFPEVPKARRLVGSWWTDMTAVSGTFKEKENRFLYIVGGSKSKATAAVTLVAAWQPSWPPLELWCPSAIASEVRPHIPAGASVVFQTDYKTKAEKEERQRACKWHVTASAAEGFGYTMAEAIACGAPVLWTDLPIYEETWGLTQGRIPTVLDPSPSTSTSTAIANTGVYREGRRSFRPEAVAPAVAELLTLDSTDIMLLQRQYALRMQRCRSLFLDGWARILELKRAAGLPATIHLPASGSTVNAAADSRVGILTVTKNRKTWWPNMLANVTGQKWPSAKLVWILVDDGALAAEVATLKGTLDIVHVIVPEPASIGLKRNRGVLAAPPDVTRFVIMDDDDHYPPDSVGGRLPWISGSRYTAAYCSTLPMYDVTRYISAMNVPPLTLAPAERVSEASLAFTRAFWTARPFPEVSMAEGEGFLAGREHDTVEIPPYGVIVSFIHGSNASGRRVPADQEPNGCHYGFKDEYFRYIHGCVTE